jgi:hypothetical protein
MRQRRWQAGREQLAWYALWFVVAGLFVLARVARAAPSLGIRALPTPSGPVASPEQLSQARAEWSRSAHSETYDGGLGANTTCARCKSPENWDPGALAASRAVDCASCKRIPGAPRPALEGGAPVEQSDWHGLRCEVCHVPAGNSYYIGVAYWNQSTGSYEAVAGADELCARCHEGQHGFEVMAEQRASPAHQGWACTRCHGAHGEPARCAGCHDPTLGIGAEVHGQHLQVNCTACHDAASLGLWHDQQAGSRHQGQVVPVRFAHTLTSWPSHNLQLGVDCRRCHHPRSSGSPAVAAELACEACHAGGAVLIWCPALSRDPEVPVAASP